MNIIINCCNKESTSSLQCKKIILIVLITLVLASCTTRNLKPPPTNLQPASPKSSLSIRPPQVSNELVPLPPKIKTINWLVSLSPMVKKMLRVPGLSDGSLLFINTLKNATNGNIQTGKATSALIHLILESGSALQVVNAKKLNIARQILGLSINDNLELRSTAVGVARYLNAKYLLYSAASGDITAPTLTLQLILVKTGEIIWSDNSILTKT